MENHAAGAVLTDQECVDKLRRLRPQQHESVIEHLAGKAPSELERRPFFFAAGPPLVSPIVTPHGSWNVRNVKKHMAIRASGVVESRPRYVGVKTILEFVPKSAGKNSKHAGKKRGLDLDDTMADCWIMIQYHNLREEGPAEDIKFVIEEETGLCRILHTAAPVREILQDIKRQLNSSDSEEQVTPSEEDLMKWRKELEECSEHHPKCDDARSPAAGGKSEVWHYFTKIHQKKQIEKDLQFAACHECGEMLMADPKKHGTSSLKRHRAAHVEEKCTGKAKEEQ